MIVNDDSSLEILLLSTLEQLREKKLYELEAFVSFGMDTGIRPSDIVNIRKEDIIGNTVSDVSCKKTNGKYGKYTLSKRTMHLLSYLPKTGKIFSNKCVYYSQEIKKNTNLGDNVFNIHYARMYKLKNICKTINNKERR